MEVSAPPVPNISQFLLAIKFRVYQRKDVTSHFFIIIYRRISYEDVLKIALYIKADGGATNERWAFIASCIIHDGLISPPDRK
jgi:hypothetical protein